jgi:hypothetical protein
VTLRAWRDRDERPITSVPRTVLIVLLSALALQLMVRAYSAGSSARPTALPAPPSGAALRLVAMGDVLPVARVTTLYLQSFDQHAGNPIAFQSFDYERLSGWLQRVLDLDPAGQYPLMLASRVYAEVADPERQRTMLEFVYDRFLEDPARRWPWLAHATVIAKHRLEDLPLARRYAAAIQRHAPREGVPAWARQMEAFILEDMNELEAARVMIGGFIAEGVVSDPGELRFLEQRLHELERRQSAAK